MRACVRACVRVGLSARYWGSYGKSVTEPARASTRDQAPEVVGTGGEKYYYFHLIQCTPPYSKPVIALSYFCTMAWVRAPSALPPNERGASQTRGTVTIAGSFAVDGLEGPLVRGWLRSLLGIEEALAVQWAPYAHLLKTLPDLLRGPGRGGAQLVVVRAGGLPPRNGPRSVLELDWNPVEGGL